MFEGETTIASDARLRAMSLVLRRALRERDEDWFHELIGRCRPLSESDLLRLDAMAWGRGTDDTD